MTRTPYLRAVVLALLLGLALLLAGEARAQAPTAGTAIGNVSTATYTDGSGTTRSVTSNTVTTIVQQVASLTLTANNTKYSTAGGPVYFPHTLTNTGNGADTFGLTITQSGADNFDLSGVAIYPDSNGDGLPDAGTSAITSTGPVAAGGVFQFVIVGTAPGPTGNAQLTVTAASVLTPAQTASNTDTAIITTGAVIPVNKSVSAPSGPSGSGPYTYTLSYTNKGNATATNLVLTDLLPAGITYVAGSGRWSNSGATALTDAAGGDPAGVAYDFNITTAGTVTATIASVPAGASGTITFQFNVNAGAPAGIIYNEANVAYDDGTGTNRVDKSNKVPFTVTVVAAVDIVGDTEATAPQGAVVRFDNPVTNNGNRTDTFDITTLNVSFPAGTSFVLYQSDGQTPLLDSNSSGIPDTGPLAPGATYNLVVKAILPANAVSATPVSVNVTARSANDSTVFDTAPDTLNQITAATVDLTNDSAGGGAPGAGAGPEANPVKTNAVNPGASTQFVLYVNNTSAQADAYVLEASTDPTFATLTLPAGWSVSFIDDNGTAIADTGLIASGGNMRVRANITTAANSAAGDREIYFRAKSPTTNTLDVKHDRVSVNTVRGISIVPNNTGQVYPGGSVVYTHTIRNTGNVVEGDAAGEVVLSMTNNLNGFTSVTYWDRDNDGILDPTDPAVTDLSSLVGGSNGASTSAGLDIGEGATLFVKVYAPPGAVVGSTNATNVIATTTGAINTIAAPPPAVATDTSNIISGDLTVEKFQALDAAGDGTPDAAYSTNVITGGAVPGACIRYKITVTNSGTAPALNVVVTDATPAFTVYHTGDGTTSATGIAVYTLNGTTFTAITAPAAGSGGNLSANIGNLNPGQSATVYFGVRIRP